MKRNLFSMVRFAEVFPDIKIVQSLIAQSSRTHLRQGHPQIAQRFSAGSREQNDSPAPEGRQNLWRSAILSSLAGLVTIGYIGPTDKSVGYYLSPSRAEPTRETRS